MGRVKAIRASETNKTRRMTGPPQQTEKCSRRMLLASSASLPGRSGNGAPESIVTRKDSRFLHSAVAGAPTPVGMTNLFSTMTMIPRVARD